MAALNVTQSTVKHWMPKKPKLAESVTAGQGKRKTMHQEHYHIVSKALLDYLTARSNLNAPLPGESVDVLAGCVDGGEPVVSCEEAVVPLDFAELVPGDDVVDALVLAWVVACKKGKIGWQ